MADDIAAAVMWQLEQSGRLLPTAVPGGVDAASDDSDQEDVDAILSSLLGGELNTPLPTYNVVNKPLGRQSVGLAKSYD